MGISIARAAWNASPAACWSRVTLPVVAARSRAQRPTSAVRAKSVAALAPTAAAPAALAPTAAALAAAAPAAAAPAAAAPRPRAAPLVRTRVARQRWTRAQAGKPANVRSRRADDARAASAVALRGRRVAGRGRGSGRRALGFRPAGG